MASAVEMIVAVVVVVVSVAVVVVFIALCKNSHPYYLIREKTLYTY